MAVLNVYDLTRKRALITRGSAAKIGAALADAWDGDVLSIDFSGVEAVTPSFVDEVLIAIENVVSTPGRANATIIFLNPPTRLSEKFAAVGRAHRLSAAESDDGNWHLTFNAD